LPEKSKSETVLPPSRGNRNAGAAAPSISTDDSRADARAAETFDDAGLRATNLDGLNGFDGALCEALLVVLLLDPTVAARPLFACFIFVDVVDGRRVGLREGVLVDFLRVFLDIRLPFVAFGGSIIRLLQILSG
jgi:hypothetical protein